MLTNACAQEGIRDHDDHGPKFKAKMNAINVSHAPDHERPPEGYAIDTHHTMIDEVMQQLWVSAGSTFGTELLGRNLHQLLGLGANTVECFQA